MLPNKQHPKKVGHVINHGRKVVWAESARYTVRVWRLNQSPARGHTVSQHWRLKKIKLAVRSLWCCWEAKLHTSCKRMCTIWAVELQLSHSSLEWLSSLSVSSSSSLQYLNDICAHFPSWKPNNKSEDVTHAICIVRFVPSEELWCSALEMPCQLASITACKTKNRLKARDTMEERYPKTWAFASKIYL